MPMTPSEIGARAEHEIQHALWRCGWTVYLPHLAPHARVDMIAVRDSTLLRIQAKTSVVRGSALAFRACSNTGNVPKDYRDDVDALAVYSPELHRVYLIPIADAPTRVGHLRLTAPANNQVKGTRLAADYELRPPD